MAACLRSRFLAMSRVNPSSSASTSLNAAAPFADQADVSLHVRTSQTHGLQFCDFDPPPLNGPVSNVRFGDSDVLLSVKHLAKSDFELSSNRRFLPLPVEAGEAGVAGEELLHGGLLEAALFGDEPRQPLQQRIHIAQRRRDGALFWERRNNDHEPTKVSQIQKRLGAPEGCEFDRGLSKVGLKKVEDEHRVVFL